MDVQVALLSRRRTVVQVEPEATFGVVAEKARLALGVARARLCSSAGDSPRCQEGQGAGCAHATGELAASAREARLYHNPRRRHSFDGWLSDYVFSSQDLAHRLPPKRHCKSESN